MTKKEFSKLTKEQIDKINGWDISWLLREQPALWNKFTKEQIDKMSGWARNDVIG